MDLLQNILGGGQQRQQFEDFANRYQQGSPWDGVSDEEAINNYRQVSPHLSNEQWQESAQESFSRLTPQQRMELGQHLIRGAQQQGYQFPDVNHDGVDDRMQDPRHLAQAAGRMRQEQPGLFSQILGSSLGGNMMNSGVTSGGQGGGMGQLLGNPIAKAALAGIAASAVQRMMNNR